MKQSFLHLLINLFITIIYSIFLTDAHLSYFPSANISTKWKNIDLSTPDSQTTMSGGHVTARPILIKRTSGPAFACGFYCYGIGSSSSFFFSIFIAFPNGDGDNSYYESPQVVWSANRDRPVQESATLVFSEKGDLILKDFDGTHVWSTNTSGKSVVRMEVNDVGNLLLLDDKNRTVWSSMDHPTDTLVLGQTLKQRQSLTSSTSATNSSQGIFNLSVVRGGFQMFVGSNPQQLYYDRAFHSEQEMSTHLSFNNGSLSIYAGDRIVDALPLPFAKSIQYVQLDYAGHLRLYEFEYSFEWISVADVLNLVLDDCEYPTVCGEYGICSNGHCTCPATDNDGLSYFRPLDQKNPRVGCSPSAAISCKSNKTQQFLFLPNVSYFNYIGYAAMHDTDVESCKQACLMDCSCKAALFQYGPDEFSGKCYLPSQLFSLLTNTQYKFNSSAFIKVQSLPITNSRSGSQKVRAGVIVGSLLSSFLLVVCIIVFLRRRSRRRERRRYRHRETDDEEEINMLPGLPIRFTFEELRVATNDFLQKLGGGGFGSVFKGILFDGTKIAVKRLSGVDQGKKEFLAEVKTIGSIHHIHLVKLVGFCAEKSHRLLVYEYMPNGSLDRWIFYKKHNFVIQWQTRRKIITDIAKGLAYLHEECRQKIVHLDIKPQNILLDGNFDAKVSDFGLAKLVEKDQIQVMTRMRGTPGYLAPEWLTSFINEKVDVFSFGIVVLEIICGRKNLDYSKENIHLISLLQQKVEKNKLTDIIDCRSSEMHELHVDDVIVIMRLAMWCLQSDSSKRPSMTVVLKVLEGSMNVDANLDYNFSNPAPYVSQNTNIVASFVPIATVLSGPR